MASRFPNIVQHKLQNRIPSRSIELIRYADLPESDHFHQADNSRSSPATPPTAGQAPKKTATQTDIHKTTHHTMLTVFCMTIDHPFLEAIEQFRQLHTELTFLFSKSQSNILLSQVRTLAAGRAAFFSRKSYVPEAVFEQGKTNPRNLLESIRVDRAMAKLPETLSSAGGVSGMGAQTDRRAEHLHRMMAVRETLGGPRNNP